MILQENLPYGMTSRNNNHNNVSLGFLESCYNVDARELAAKVSASIKKDLQQQQQYYASLDDVKKANLQYEYSTTQNLMNALNEMDKKYGSKNSHPALQ